MFPDEIFNVPSLSIIGMEKNAGKTTLLNALLEEAARKKPDRVFAITSIGRDGEQKDVVTSTHKPRIYVRAGTLVATAKELISKGDVTKEIIMSTDLTTPIGRIVLYRALSDGFVEIAGPSSVEASAKVKEFFKEVNEHAQYIVDGALSRKSTAGHFLTEAAILSTGASVSSDIYEVVEATAHTASLFQLEAAYVGNIPDAAIVLIGKEVKALDTLIGFSGVEEISEAIDESVHTIVIRGAVTGKFLKDLFTAVNVKGIRIIAEDATRFLGKYDIYKKLKTAGGELGVLNKINLLAISINPVSPKGYRFDSLEFEKLLRRKVDIDVIDVLRS